MAFAFQHLWRYPGVLVTLSLLCQRRLEEDRVYCSLQFQVMVHYHAKLTQQEPETADGWSHDIYSQDRATRACCYSVTPYTVQSPFQERPHLLWEGLPASCHHDNHTSKGQRLTFHVILGSVTLTGTNHHPWQQMMILSRLLTITYNKFY